MKRFLAVILAVLYTLSSVGMTVSSHYCAGKQMKCKCAKSKKDSKKDHCCKDTVQYLKAQDNHNGPEIQAVKKGNTLEFSMEILHSSVLPVLINLSSTYSYQKGFAFKSPPLYELFCNYRI